MKNRVIYLFAIFLLSFSASSSADETYTFVVKKQAEKAQVKKGWNLTDWIAQRDSMRTRDLWLAMHTPTPYEFYFGGDYRFLNEPQDERDHRFQFGAFAKIFGLTFEAETEPKRYNAFFNVRVFGLHQQGTNITLYGGMRSQSDAETFRSGVYGASLTLYLHQKGGLEGGFRKYLDGTPVTSGSSGGGNQVEANIFLDFSFLRLYGGYLETSLDPSREKGYQLGARIFF